MISIIIPMYNVEDKIERTLNCIEEQRIKEKYEIIIIDDCSVDDSYNICKKYIKNKKIKNAIVLKNTENRGPSYTRNKGMKLANGEYCILLDSDDYYEKNTINTMLENMKPKSIVIVGIKYIYRKNKIKYLLYGEKNKIMNIESNQYAKFYLTGLLNQPSNKMYDLNYIKEKNIFFNFTRQMAEFDNFRKRTEKEKSQMYEVGAKDIIEKILPVVDNFERGLDAVPKEKKEDPFIQGMEKVYKQFMTVLESVEVKPIEALGNQFDPNFHNAVMHVEDENFGENEVAEEFQKGYMYRDSVVRHSMVKVAN